MMQHRVQQFVVQYLPSGLLNMNTPSGPPSAAHGHHHHHQHHHHGHHHHHHHAGGLSPPTKGLGFFAPPTSAPFSGPLLEPGYPISSAPSFAPPSATIFSAPAPKAASWHPRRAGIFNSYGPAPSPLLSDDTSVVATPWWLIVVIGGLFVVFLVVIVWICIRKRRGRQAVDPCSELKSIRIDPRGGDEGLVFYNVTVNKVFNLQDDTEQQQQQAAVESVKDQVHAHGVDNGLEFENVPLSKVIDLIGDETEQQQELATVDSVEGLVFYNVPLSKVINLEDDTEQQQQQEDDAEDDARQQRLHQAAVKFLKESAESLAEAERQKRQQREQMLCAQVERILRGRDEHAAYDAWIEQQAHAEARLRSNENQQLRLIEDEQREQLICLIHADCINRCSCNKKQVLHDDDDQSRVWEQQQQQSMHGFPKKFEDEEGKKSRPDSNQQNWQQKKRAQEEQSRSEERRIRKQLNANELRDEEDKKTELFGDDRDQQDLDPINQQEGKRRIAKTLVHEEAGKQEQERAQEEERVGFDELKNVTELADKKAGDAYGCEQQQQKSRAQQIAAIIHNHKQQQLQRIREHTAKQKERVEATADEHKQRQAWQELEKLREDEEQTRQEAKLFDNHDDRDQQQQQQSRADGEHLVDERAKDEQKEQVDAAADENKHRQLWQELEQERAEEELARLKQREERMTKTKTERQLAVFRGFLARRAEMEKREQQQQGSFVDKDGRVLDLPLPPCRSNPLFVLDPGEEMLREMRAAELARFEQCPTNLFY